MRRLLKKAFPGSYFLFVRYTKTAKAAQRGGPSVARYTTDARCTTDATSKECIILKVGEATTQLDKR